MVTVEPHIEESSKKIAALILAGKVAEASELMHQSLAESVEASPPRRWEIVEQKPGITIWRPALA
ncbi:MAG: hypothetical protein AB7G06_08910 [Bdellovibrionales bacterium]